MVDYQTRQELNALSLEVFGASSRWQKLIDNGYPEVLTEEVDELIPSDVPGEEAKLEKVKKPVLVNGMKQSVTKRHTVESIRELMLDLKAKREEFMAKIKQMQEEQAAAQKAAEEQKQAAQKVQEEASGSVV